LLRTDVAGLLRGFEALKSAPDASVPAVIVPVTVSSLSIPTGRARIVMGLKEARSYVQGGVICELRGLDGVPPAQVLEAIGVVRPFSLLVIGQLDDLSIATARPLRGLGLNGASTRAPPNLVGAAFIGWATAALQGGRHVSKSVLIYGLGSDHAMRVAHSLGVTHASLRAAP
jgi:hypothetical protein